MRRCHEWKSTSPEGARVLFRATKDRGVWILRSLDADSDGAWMDHDRHGRQALEELRDLLRRKYQRRRVPWEEVLSVDRMIEALPEDPAGDANPSPSGA